MYTLKDYSDAPSGVGPLADVWRDKPHRLIYDLCKRLAPHEKGYGCHCDLEPGESPDGCVLLGGRVTNCVYAMTLAKEGKGPHSCEFWKPI